MSGSWWREWLDLTRSDLPLNRPSKESIATMAIWRFGQVLHDRPGAAAFALRRVHGIVDQLWVRNTIGAELPRSVVVGPGMKLPHAGRGVIVHPEARIGAGVTLHHRVTIGVRNDARPPHIADGVYLGAGAAVLGPVDLGTGCKIGANAVVVKDVAAGATVVSPPARVLEPPAARAAVTEA